MPDFKISLMSMKFLSYFHEKEMLKQRSLCKKFSKQNVERNTAAYLIAGKILRTTEITLR